MKIVSRINFISNISGGPLGKDLCAYLDFMHSLVALWKSLAVSYKHSITLGIIVSTFNSANCCCTAPHRCASIIFILH